MQDRSTQSHASTRLRILTYNVHGCRGSDGVYDPGRIADVIAACAPDIVALQEIDVGRLRSGNVDQAEQIARRLAMEPHFSPALHIAEERYGDAILSALPSRLVRTGPLPSRGEPRGALWVEIEAHGRKLNVINTHLGLWPGERVRQAGVLLGEDWAGHADCLSSPTIVLGDFNAGPGSPAFKLMAATLKPAGLPLTGRPPATFPARYPLLRLDHIFCNETIEILDLTAVATQESRRASDHLPLLATVAISIRAEPESAMSTQTVSEVNAC